MKIAILGTRGIPASYGGFETFAQELAVRLVERGHQVIVYSRRKFGVPVKNEQFQGVEIRFSGTIYHKYLETPLASLSSFLALARRDCDLAILCNAANSPFAWLLRLKGIPVLINVDGIERKRAKWNAIGRLWYHLGELCSVLFASRIIADADVIAEYYRERFSQEPLVIRYGAEPKPLPSGATHQQFALTPQSYILYVSRFEPENNALLVVQAYVDSQVTIPLVMVGDAPYADEYKAQVRAAAGTANVIFTGYQFGEAYRELRTNCQFYIQATEVGGTHPALVEAMAYGNAILANDCPEHREVLLEGGEYYHFNDRVSLTEKIRLLANSPERRAELAVKAQQRAQQEFSWDKITEQYLEAALKYK